MRSILIHTDLLIDTNNALYVNQNMDCNDILTYIDQ